MKIGDYVRFKDGDIGKISFISEHKKIGKIIMVEDCYINFKEGDIFKSSSNLIDLIEVGDYINGREVREVTTFGCLKGGEPIYRFKNDYNRFYDKNYKIKSIVTKEQFESMEYKVGD